MDDTSVWSPSSLSQNEKYFGVIVRNTQAWLIEPCTLYAIGLFWNVCGWYDQFERRKLSDGIWNNDILKNIRGILRTWWKVCKIPCQKIQTFLSTFWIVKFTQRAVLCTYHSKYYGKFRGFCVTSDVPKGCLEGRSFWIAYMYRYLFMHLAPGIKCGLWTLNKWLFTFQKVHTKKGLSFVRPFNA